MRSDMHKVIVERPRWGRGPERLGRRDRLPLEKLPRHESMRACHTNRKHFGENLAPLRRWLLSQVGRPWAQVYSEACEVIKPDSTVRNHIKVHLLQMVELHTFGKDGRVWCFRQGWCQGSREVPIDALPGGWTCCYVHPVTGVLRPIPRVPRRACWRERESARRLEYCRWLDEHTTLLKICGCWFECNMRAMLASDDARSFDLTQHQAISRRRAERLYGKAMVCAAKRQLSHRQLRHYALRNSPAGSVPGPSRSVSLG